MPGNNSVFGKTIKLLLVEDEPAMARMVELALNDELAGGFEIKRAADLSSAIDLSGKQPFDVVLLDLNLPDSTGMDTMKTFKAERPDLPVVVLTGFEDKQFSVDVIRSGAQDYLVKGDTPSGTMWRAVFYAMERQKTNIELERSYDKLSKLSNGIITAMEKIVEARDPYTAGHQRNVAVLARAIARHMGLDEETVTSVFIGGMIHDLGKIRVPSEILTKPGKLGALEFDFIKTHPSVGHEILSTIEFPWPIHNIVLQHHERMNGRGYPNGLRGSDIMLEARIVAVADVVEAMAASRPYRAALGIDRALDEIRQNSGELYDPECVKACIELFETGNFVFGKESGAL